MERLEMIKAFAELEGVDLIEDNSVFYHARCVRMNCNSEYNPIKNLALNCAARDKYKVSVDYSDWSDTKHCNVDIWTQVINETACTKSCCGESYYDVDFDANENCDVDCMDQSDIPHAVIECILKSKGLWK